MKRASITAAAILLGPVIGLILLRGPLNDWYNEQEGLITGILFLVSSYLLAFEFYYLKNEQFYLFVQRFLMRFRRTHTYWRLTVAYEGAAVVDANRAPLGRQLAEQLRDVFEERSRGNCSWEIGANFANVLIDDRDRYSFGFDYPDRRASISSSNMLVPSHLYERNLKELSGLLSRIEKVLHPASSDYRLEISFEERNPYFGFFVQHIPQELVRNFRCGFRTAPIHGSQCTIEATESTILVNASDQVTLQEAATKYLTLSSSLITHPSGGD